MPTITVKRIAGDERTIEAIEGESLMEAIRNAGMDELQALCGGTLACATCHIIVDPEWIERTGRASQDEEDLLCGSDYRTDFSRLSCQMMVDSSLNGLRVEIAPGD